MSRVLRAVAIAALCSSAGADGRGALPAAETKPAQPPATYYVDAESGLDRHAGRTPDSAWQSLERVNAADLKPGDTIRFKRGGVWRGSLVPVSGDEHAPVTYTAYGQGPKPLLLGSRPRHRPEDWVNLEGSLWATQPMRCIQEKLLLNLRPSQWTLHQEKGAQANLTHADTAEGVVVKVACTAGGTSSNHVQIWGPAFPATKGTHLQLIFRARCSQPMPLPTLSLRQGVSPWKLLAVATTPDRKIGPTWQTFESVFEVSESSDGAKLHFLLGGVLPAGAVFELQPESIHFASLSPADPLTVDVGNIIFDHGRICGWKKWRREDLSKPYDYCYDRSSQRVFLHCPANPATLHSSIELALARHVVNQGGKHHLIYDGLAIKYGAAHGFGGGNTHHIVTRNCDLGYIGGAHQHTRPDGRPVRYGNAIEFWGAAHDHLVEGCRIWEVYDAALTNQGRDPSSHQNNITYRNNFIRNAEYSFEYWNHPAAAVTKNIRFTHNTCLNAGTVWSHAQRPDRNGSHLMFYSNTAETSGVEIKYNVFCGHTEWGSRYSSGWQTRPDLDYNLWFSDQGVIVNWFGEKIGSFENYRAKTGLDPHSVFARPKFVDEARGDYRLTSDSPGARLGSDGTGIGAASPTTDQEQMSPANP